MGVILISGTAIRPVKIEPMTRLLPRSMWPRLLFHETETDGIPGTEIIAVHAVEALRVFSLLSSLGGGAPLTCARTSPAVIAVFANRSFKEGIPLKESRGARLRGQRYLHQKRLSTKVHSHDK